MSTTGTTTTTTRTEYGFRTRGAGLWGDHRDLWPVDGKVRPYTSAAYRGPGWTMPVDATDLDAMHAAAEAFTTGNSHRYEPGSAEVISREVRVETTVEETPGAAVVVPAPVGLPTTPGSVVRATASNGRRGIFVHNDTSAAFPWTGRPSAATSDPYRYVADSWEASHLRDVEVLFEAPAE